MSADAPGSICQNCGLALKGRYCHGCSQDSQEGTPSAWEWLKEGFEEITTVESRGFRSLWMLITRPGALTVAWREGKRVAYTRPLRLLLFCLLALFVARSFFDVDLGFTSSLAMGFLEGGSGGEGVDEAAVLERTEAIFRWFTLALVPIVAGVVAWFFRGWAFSEHFVFTLHVVCYALVVRALFALVEWAGMPEVITQPVQVVLIFGYGFLAMRRAYGQSLGKTTAKFIAVALISSIVWSAAAISLVLMDLQ